MKNLLLLLILANILYLMWGMFTPEEPQPGIAVVEENDLGPPLEVSAGRDSESVTSVGAVLGSGEPSALEAVVGRSCVTIGPIKVRGDADSAVLEYRNEGMRTALRLERGQIFIGHDVKIRDVASRQEGREIVRQLGEQGLGDAFIVGNDEDGYAIALGIFGNASNAERVELQARSAGFEATIEPMTRDDQIYFVDIGLPPGKGAGAIVERFGEDQVALREAATCPR
jgi:hypothetical protein